MTDTFNLQIHQKKKKMNRGSLLVLWVGEGTGAGFAVVMETSDHTVESRSAAFTPITLCVVLTVLRTRKHTREINVVSAKTFHSFSNHTMATVFT